MWNAVVPLVVLGFPALSGATAPVPWFDPGPATGITSPLTCLSHPSSTARQAGCAQFAAAAKLRLRPQPLPIKPAVSISGAGKGALIGLGVGVGLGTVVALVAAQGCEENESRCSVALIVGGAALGALIGTVVGALTSQ